METFALNIPELSVVLTVVARTCFLNTCNYGVAKASVRVIHIVDIQRW